MNSNNYQHITHKSINSFIDNNSSILILGSFPSIKSRIEEFYYAHPSNSKSELLENPFFLYKNILEKPIFWHQKLLENPI